ncbi:MAG: hypothetical protein Q9190_007510, partial [Brigantiaea leucoxantha]
MSENVHLWRGYPIGKWREAVSTSRLEAVVSLLDPTMTRLSRFSKNELFSHAQALIESHNPPISTALVFGYFAVDQSKLSAAAGSVLPNQAFRTEDTVSSRTRSSPVSISKQPTTLQTFSPGSLQARQPFRPSTFSENPPTPNSHTSVISSLDNIPPDKAVHTPEDYVLPREGDTQLLLMLQKSLWNSCKWTLPLDAGCSCLFPVLPSTKGFNVCDVSALRAAILNQRLSTISTFSLIFKESTKAASLSSEGVRFPLRGRGSVWEKQSCAVDCCIVAGRLLNVGSTIADRGNLTRREWLQALKPEERNFMRCIALDWEQFTVESSKRHRNSFSTRSLHLKIGEMVHATSVWNLCTKRMGQFSFSEIDNLSKCRNCGRSAPQQATRSQTFVSLDLDTRRCDALKQPHEEKPSMSAVLQQYFGSTSRRCGSCKHREGRTKRAQIAGELPPRLVVQPGKSFGRLVSGVTSPKVFFTYLSENGEEEEATYRWLGGIYYLGRLKHFRVYWNDGSNGSQSNFLKIYDGNDLFGSIYGEVPPFGDDEENSVPPEWAAGATVLFYERINQGASERAGKDLSGFISEKIQDIFSDMFSGSCPLNYDLTDEDHNSLRYNQGEYKDTATSRPKRWSMAQDGNANGLDIPEDKITISDEFQNKDENELDSTREVSGITEILAKASSGKEKGQVEQLDDVQEEVIEKEIEKEEQAEEDADKENRYDLFWVEEDPDSKEKGQEEENEEDKDEDPSIDDNEIHSESSDNDPSNGPPPAIGNSEATPKDSEPPTGPRTPPPRKTPPQSPKGDGPASERQNEGLFSRFFSRSLLGFKRPFSPTPPAKPLPTAPSDQPVDEPMPSQPVLSPPLTPKKLSISTSNLLSSQQTAGLSDPAASPKRPVSASRTTPPVSPKKPSTPTSYSPTSKFHTQESVLIQLPSPESLNFISPRSLPPTPKKSSAPLSDFTPSQPPVQEQVTVQSPSPESSKPTSPTSQLPPQQQHDPPIQVSVAVPTPSNAITSYVQYLKAQNPRGSKSLSPTVPSPRKSQRLQ